MTTMSKFNSQTFKRWRIIIRRKLFWLIYKKILNIQMEKITQLQRILTCIFLMTNSIKHIKFKRKLFWKYKLKLKILKYSKRSTLNFMMLCPNGWKHFLDFKIYLDSFMMKKKKTIMKIISKFYKICQNNMSSMKAIPWMKISV